MPTPAHRRARVAATVGAATAHGYLTVIGALDLLNYTVPTKYALLDEVAADHLWVWIHGIAALLLALSLIRPNSVPKGVDSPLAAYACWFGFAMMFSWAFFNMLWGLSSIRPVSLAGPGLAFAVAAGEQLLANAWMRGTQHKVR